MSLNASIIEQRVAKLVEEHRGALGPGDDDELRSKAFVWLVREQEQALLAMSAPHQEVREVMRFLPYSTHAVAMFVGEELFAGRDPQQLQREHGALLAALGEAASEYYSRGMLEVRLLLAIEGLDERHASLQRLAGAFRGGLLFERARLVREMVDEWDRSIAQHVDRGRDGSAPLPDAAPPPAAPDSVTSQHASEMAQRFRAVFRLWAALRLRASAPT